MRLLTRCALSHYVLSELFLINIELNELYLNTHLLILLMSVKLERLVDPSTGNLYYKEGHLINSNFPPRTLRIILLHVQGVYYPRIRWIGNTCEDGCNRNALKMNLGGISKSSRAYVDDEAFLYLTRSNIPIVTTKIFLDGCDRRDCCDEVIVVRRSAC